MLRAEFWHKGGSLVGFCLTGHCGGVSGRDIVCAAVSSAAYMTANTITDVCGISADIAEQDGRLRLRLPDTEDAAAQVVLQGFSLHLHALCEQYPRQIEVIDRNDTEV